MLCYLIAIHFVIFGNSKALLSYWMAEVIRREKNGCLATIKREEAAQSEFPFLVEIG